jgi:hypothetical protein
MKCIPAVNSFNKTNRNRYNSVLKILCKFFYCQLKQLLLLTLYYILFLLFSESLWNCFFFLYTYYVGIAVMARWTASGISSEILLTIKTFEIWHKFHRNSTITHATQKSLDYFIIRFLSFYQINATKVEKIVYYTRFIRRTVTLRSSCPNQLVSQSNVL